MDLIITILPLVTKDLLISPRFTPYDFLSRCKFNTVVTTHQPMVELYLLTFPRFPLRKKEHKSYFGKNRTHDFRTSRCAGYLLDFGNCRHTHEKKNTRKTHDKKTNGQTVHLKNNGVPHYPPGSNCLVWYFSHAVILCYCQLFDGLANFSRAEVFSEVAVFSSSSTPMSG